MNYILAIIALIGSLGFSFYKGYELKSHSVQLNVLKIEKQRLQIRTKSLELANAYATKQNLEADKVNKQNQEKIDDLQKQIANVKPVCDKPILDGKFLRSLGNLR